MHREEMRMPFRHVRYASIEDLDCHEYGEEILQELIRQSEKNVNAQKTQPKRRALVLTVLERCGAHIDIDVYLLAITLIDRLLRVYSQQVVEQFFVDKQTTCLVADVVVRLALKYDDRHSNSYYWLYRGATDDDVDRMNRAERQLWVALDYDLHWPTPIAFADILLEIGPRSDNLQDAVETILVLVSINDYFDTLPAHTLAAASYNLCCKLLCLEPWEHASVAQWASFPDECSPQRLHEVTLNLEATILQELSMKKVTWAGPCNDLPGKARWISVLLSTRHLARDPNRCQHRLQAVKRRCLNKLWPERHIERQRLMQSLRYDNLESMGQVLLQVYSLSLCRRWHCHQVDLPQDFPHSQLAKNLRGLHVVCILSRNSDLDAGSGSDVTARKPAPAGHLPVEILDEIFSFLASKGDWYRCMLTSWPWAKSAVRLLWREPSCQTWEDFSRISRVVQCKTPFLPYQDFVRILDFNQIADRLDDESLSPFTACKNVEVLRLVDCASLTDNGLIRLLQMYPSLRTIDISKNKVITNESLDSMTQTCRRLEQLSMRGCVAISNDCLRGLVTEQKHITTLDLRGCVQVRDDVVFALAKHCQQLHTLDLDDCVEVGSEAVKFLLSGKTMLRQLNLSNCILIDNVAFSNLSSLAHLTKLDLSFCDRLTDNAVDSIVVAAPRLRTVTLAGCYEITDAAVRSVARLGKSLQRVLLADCGQITDDGVSKLLQNCPDIRFIGLISCTNVTDNSLEKLALLPHLTNVALSECRSISGKSVLAIAETASRQQLLDGPRLQSVRLAGCVNICVEVGSVTNLQLQPTAKERQSITSLLNSSPHLTFLSLSDVDAFKDSKFRRLCNVEPTGEQILNDPEKITLRHANLIQGSPAQSVRVFSDDRVDGLRRYLNGDEYNQVATVAESLGSLVLNES